MDKILVVDDDVDILTLVNMTLGMNGFDIRILSRWDKIDSAILEFKPDLILLDISLGGADGREICKRIKTTRETKDIPVILFSANIEMEKSFASCHAQAFISKPYELDYFLKTIRDILKNSQSGTGTNKKI